MSVTLTVRPSALSAVPSIKLILLIVHDSSTTFTLHILNVTNCLLGSIYDCYSCFYFEVSHISVFIRCRSTLFFVFNSTSLKSTRAFSVNRVNPIFKCCFFADKVIINDPKSAVYTHSGASCPAPNQALVVNLVYSVLQMIVSCLWPYEIIITVLLNLLNLRHHRSDCMHANTVIRLIVLHVPA